MSMVQRQLCRQLSWAFAALCAPLHSEAQAQQTWLRHAEIPAAVRAAPGNSSDVHLCSIHAYSRDPDPKGSNLRSGPSLKASVITKIPGGRSEAGTQVGPEFHIVGSKAGWFLINNAYWAAYDREEEQIFTGLAWISASLIDFSVEGHLRSRPRAEAPIIMRLSDKDGLWGPDSIRVEKVFGCSGSFIEAAISTPDGKITRGWLSGICGNQVTTCGGSSPEALVEERDGTLIETYWEEPDGELRDGTP